MTTFFFFFFIVYTFLPDMKREVYSSSTKNVPTGGFRNRVSSMFAREMLVWTVMNMHKHVLISMRRDFSSFLPSKSMFSTFQWEILRIEDRISWWMNECQRFVMVSDRTMPLMYCIAICTNTSISMHYRNFKHGWKIEKWKMFSIVIKWFFF